MALARGGNLVIPVFALERTQELLLDLARLINEGRLRRPQVFIDSPLASRITGIFRRRGAELEDLSDGEIFDHPAFHFVEGVEQSMRLNSVSGAIILAASGMCEGGRIRHHLRHNLARADSTVLFVGFQAQGTLGRAIADGAGRVRISGHDVAVRAAIRRIDTYSAHAYRAELIAWVEARRPIHAAAAGMSDQGKASIAKLAATLAAKATSAAHFPDRLIAPPFRQARMCGPNLSFSTSPCSIRGLERAKQKAARMTNGTVGSSGTTSPTAPRRSERSPTLR